ncbi:hypothetical protein CC86DRAFT_387080 [Ophiobolus disseminans]|uniref:Uncharacterized protein n=1 Tax=Ophiobolus disseminans TaxID=1469910 RepID=A0A6A6ZHQ3_9PLEO|nr:hypothetical protein CC86DRAFT_387080 [Ophiobolus disseminans]
MKLLLIALTTQLVAASPTASGALARSPQGAPILGNALCLGSLKLNFDNMYLFVTSKVYKERAKASSWLFNARLCLNTTVFENVKTGERGTTYTYTYTCTIHRDPMTHHIYLALPTNLLQTLRRHTPTY